MALRVQMEASNDDGKWVEVNNPAEARKYKFLRARIGYPNTNLLLSVIELPTWVNELIQGRKYGTTESR